MRRCRDKEQNKTKPGEVMGDREEDCYIPSEGLSLVAI